jgi:hypothetical protein
MSTATIAFDQIEREVDKTLAIVLWLKHRKYLLMCAVLFKVIQKALCELVKALSAEKLESLSSEQISDLRKKLPEIYAALDQVLGFYAVQRLSTHALFRGSIRGLEEGAEDLSDIIEELELSGNKEFRSLLSECVVDITSKQQEGLLARM